MDSSGSDESVLKAASCNLSIRVLKIKNSVGGLA